MKVCQKAGMVFGLLVLQSVVAIADTRTLVIDCHRDFNHWNVELVAHYKALGQSVECVSLPRARGVQQIAMGELDGSALRSKEFGLQFPHLIRVEPPIKAITLVIYRQVGSEVNRDNWRSYSIATLRGAIIFDHMLAGLDVTRLGTLEAAIKQLSSGRADLLVGDTQLVPRMLRDLGVTNVEMLTPPLTTVFLYHYLQPEHREIADNLSRRLLEQGGDWQGH